MATKSLRRCCATLLAAASVSGCVVLPMHVYVARPDDGTPVFERCSLTPELPAGVRLERSGVQAIVSILPGERVNLVRVQFDVPEGSTLVLREDTLGVDARDGATPRRAPIPHINPAAPARWPELPAIQKLVLPVDTPLRGARIRLGANSFDKHYWIATPVEGNLGKELRISLPEVSIDGIPARFPEIEFTRRFAVGRGLFNC